MFNLYLRSKALNVFSFAILIAVLAPEWYTFFKSETLVFVNAWDEETYLSWQGVLGAVKIPGYYSSYINLFLHNLGVSGAKQNLIFDSIFFPLTILFTSFTFINLQINRACSFICPHSVSLIRSI